jgi:cytochrome o ubiquinol oxidase subunit 1
VAWTPIYIVGLMGTTRRMRYLEDPSLQPYFIVAAIGAVIILIGILGFVIGVGVSIKNREKLKVGDDPWDGRTLEWSTSSPPPPYNFAFTPVVHDLDAWYDMKTRGFQRPEGGFKPIHMPRNTGAGLIQSALAMVLGFAMVWYMWWLAALSFVALFAYTIWHTFDYNRDFFIPADEVERFENGRERFTPAPVPAGA